MAATKALITGVGGFVGGYLAEHLLDEDIEVRGVVRNADSGRAREHLRDRVGLFQADLTDSAAVNAVIREAAPDLLFHLAAQASVSRSWQDPSETLVNNIAAQLNLILGVIEAGIKPRILVIGSNEEYGLVSQDRLPIDEFTPLRPISPYAVSKVAQDMLGYQYFATHGLHCVRVRPFNHIGPRQTDSFVVAAFARQVAEVEAGLREPIVKVGNLDAQRDFTDVRDIVRAYRMALETGEPGEVYNIGSGRSTSIKWVLEFLISQSKAKIAVETDPDRFRPLDQPASVCDFSKFHRATGWKPEIPLERTLIETLDYWRHELDKPEGGSDR